MFKRKPPSPTAKSSIDTLIGRTTRINGDLVFAGGFHLDGQVTGNVSSEPGQPAVLSVSESGCIEGSVQVPHVVLNGSVLGDIVAAERVELGAKARVNGNVHYGIIEMALGAQINGKLIHDVSAAQPPAGTPVTG